MGAQELLKVQECYLGISRGVQEIAKLLVEYENASVVRMLEIVRLYVLVDGTSDGAARDKLTLGEVQKDTELLGNLLLTVEPVVLGAVGRLFTSRIVLLSLDLSYNLGERLKFVTERGHFSEDGFNGHCTLYKYHIFKWVFVR